MSTPSKWTIALTVAGVVSVGATYVAVWRYCVKKRAQDRTRLKPTAVPKSKPIPSSAKPATAAGSTKSSPKARNNKATSGTGTVASAGAARSAPIHDELHDHEDHNGDAVFRHPGGDSIQDAVGGSTMSFVRQSSNFSYGAVQTTLVTTFRPVMMKEFKQFASAALREMPNPLQISEDDMARIVRAYGAGGSNDDSHGRVDETESSSSTQSLLRGLASAVPAPTQEQVATLFQVLMERTCKTEERMIHRIECVQLLGALMVHPKIGPEVSLQPDIYLPCIRSILKWLVYPWTEEQRECLITGRFVAKASTEDTPGSVGEGGGAEESGGFEELCDIAFTPTIEDERDDDEDVAAAASPAGSSSTQPERRKRLTDQQKTPIVMGLSMLKLLYSCIEHQIIIKEMEMFMDRNFAASLGNNSSSSSSSGIVSSPTGASTSSSSPTRMSASPLHGEKSGGATGDINNAFAAIVLFGQITPEVYNGLEHEALMKPNRVYIEDLGQDYWNAIRLWFLPQLATSELRRRSLATSRFILQEIIKSKDLMSPPNLEPEIRIIRRCVAYDATHSAPSVHHQQSSATMSASVPRPTNRSAPGDINALLKQHEQLKLGEDPAHQTEDLSDSLRVSGIDLMAKLTKLHSPERTATIIKTLQDLYSIMVSWISELGQSLYELERCNPSLWMALTVGLDNVKAKLDEWLFFQGVVAYVRSKQAPQPEVGPASLVGTSSAPPTYVLLPSGATFDSKTTVLVNGVAVPEFVAPAYQARQQVMAVHCKTMMQYMENAFELLTTRFSDTPSPSSSSASSRQRDFALQAPLSMFALMLSWTVDMDAAFTNLAPHIPSRHQMVTKIVSDNIHAYLQVLLKYRERRWVQLRQQEAVGGNPQTSLVTHTMIAPSSIACRMIHLAMTHIHSTSKMNSTESSTPAPTVGIFPPVVQRAIQQRLGAFLTDSELDLWLRPLEGNVGVPAYMTVACILTWAATFVRLGRIQKAKELVLQALDRSRDLQGGERRQRDRLQTFGSYTLSLLGIWPSHQDVANFVIQTREALAAEAAAAATTGGGGNSSNKPNKPLPPLPSETAAAPPALLSASPSATMPTTTAGEGIGESQEDADLFLLRVIFKILPLLLEGRSGYRKLIAANIITMLLGNGGDCSVWEKQLKIPNAFEMMRNIVGAFGEDTTMQMNLLIHLEGLPNGKILSVPTRLWVINSAGPLVMAAITDVNVVHVPTLVALLPYMILWKYALDPALASALHWTPLPPCDGAASQQLSTSSISPPTATEPATGMEAPVTTSTGTSSSSSSVPEWDISSAAFKTSVVSCVHGLVLSYMKIYWEEPVKGIEEVLNASAFSLQVPQMLRELLTQRTDGFLGSTILKGGRFWKALGVYFKVALLLEGRTTITAPAAAVEAVPASVPSTTEVAALPAPAATEVPPQATDANPPDADNTSEATAAGSLPPPSPPATAPAASDSIPMGVALTDASLFTTPSPAATPVVPVSTSTATTGDQSPTDPETAPYPKHQRQAAETLFHIVRGIKAACHAFIVMMPEAHLILRRAISKDVTDAMLRQRVIMAMEDLLDSSMLQLTSPSCTMLACDAAGDACPRSEPNSASGQDGATNGSSEGYMVALRSLSVSRQSGLIAFHLAETCFEAMNSSKSGVHRHVFRISTQCFHVLSGLLLHEYNLLQARRKCVAQHDPSGGATTDGSSLATDTVKDEFEAMAFLQQMNRRDASGESSSEGDTLLTMIPLAAIGPGTSIALRDMVRITQLEELLGSVIRAATVHLAGLTLQLPLAPRKVHLVVSALYAWTFTECMSKEFNVRPVLTPAAGGAASPPPTAAENAAAPVLFPSQRLIDVWALWVPHLTQSLPGVLETFFREKRLLESEPRAQPFLATFGSPSLLVSSGTTLPLWFLLQWLASGTFGTALPPALVPHGNAVLATIKKSHASALVEILRPFEASLLPVKQ